MSGELKRLDVDNMVRATLAIQDFIEEHHICEDSAVYQNDNVILNAGEFIISLCEIVGYYKYPEDD